MVFEDLDEEARARGIKFVEESLFAAHLHGAHYFRDVPVTLTGFNESWRTELPNYRVTIPPGMLK